MLPLSLFVLVCVSLVSGQASYYDGSDDFDSPGRQAAYSHSVKSAPITQGRKGYAPPPPARARYVSRPAVKSYQRPSPPPRIEQQSYEQQSYAPQIDHSVVGSPEPYNFNYDVQDDYGNNQFRKEESDNTGTVRGSYGYTDANGVYRIVDYVADDNGFRASIRTNEPGLVEPSPASGIVENPADVKISAESSPARIREQQARYTSPAKSGSSYASAANSGSSFGSSGRYSTKY